MADNQEEMEVDIQPNLNMNKIAREHFPAFAEIADNIQQEAPNAHGKILRKDLIVFPEWVTDGTFGVALKVHSNFLGTALLKEPRNVAYAGGKEQEWERDLECISSLNYHPNIVTMYAKVYNEYTDPRPQFLLVEYMHGGSLLEFIECVANKRKPLPEGVQSTWSKQIALGMNFMHSQNIMHGDLNPNNIQLDQSHYVAKIVIFGLSRTVDARGNLTNNIGNPVYTAPEVYSDTEYNKPADVWSYGMLLYFIHYLKHPFDPWFLQQSSNMRSRLLSGRENGIPLRPTLEGEAIDGIIELCWKSNPEDRCSMTHVINAFYSQSGFQHFPSLAV